MVPGGCPPPAAAGLDVGLPAGCSRCVPKASALHEPAPAWHRQEGDKAEGALAWLGVGNQLSASVLRLTLLSTRPCCCQSCTRAAHPSTPAPRCPPPQWLHPALGTADRAGRDGRTSPGTCPVAPCSEVVLPAAQPCLQLSWVLLWPPQCPCRQPLAPSPRLPAGTCSPGLLACGCCGSVAPSPCGPAPCLRPCPLQGLLPGSGVPAGGQELLKRVPAHPSLLTACSLRAGQRTAIKRRRPGRAPRYHRRDAAKPSSPARSPPNLIIAGRPLLPPASPPNPLANCRDSQLLSGCWVNSGLIR